MYDIDDDYGTCCCGKPPTFFAPDPYSVEMSAPDEDPDDLPDEAWCDDCYQTRKDDI